MDKEMTGLFLEILKGLQGFFHDNGERKRPLKNMIDDIYTYIYMYMYISL